MSYPDRSAVVYQSFPTSNHNGDVVGAAGELVVYQSFPTSNHNPGDAALLARSVVYQSFPTSNHNSMGKEPMALLLFTSLFLHQTTTPSA